MKLKKFTGILSIILLLLCFSGCSFSIDNKIDTSTIANDYPVVVNNLTISSKPSKVAVLSGSYADVIVALGYDSSVILVSEECTQSQFAMLDTVEADDYQAFVTAGVDLVISEQLSDDALAMFEQYNIRVLVIEPAESRADLERLYSQIGSALNGAETGYATGIAKAKEVMITLDDVSRLVPSSNTVITAAVLVDLTSSAVTGDTIGDYVIESAGATNVFGSLSDGTYDFEELSIANPNFIFCGIGMKEALMNDINFQNLTAVINDQVYEIDLNNILWEGRSLIYGATALAGIMYPELLMTEEELKELEEEDEEYDLEYEFEDDSSYSELDEDLIVLPEHENYALFTTLQRGDSGDEVYEFQKRLSELGYLTIDYDGTYSAATVIAVEDFQEKIGMTPTGVADPNTLAYLYDDDAISADEEVSDEQEESDEGDEDLDSGEGDEDLDSDEDERVDENENL